jgi:HAD superfamily hydrolase (TIGR01459 family)
MQPIRLIHGLEAIAGHYDGIVSDVWGVLYNGVDGFPDGIEALRKARAAGLRVVLVTNAPRRALAVLDELGRFGIDDSVADAVITSGDVCRRLIGQETRTGAAYIGTAGDMEVLEGLDVALVPDAEASYVICTGLDDDTREAPEDYRARLAALAARGLPFYCVNPDIVVSRGDDLVYCAGSLAALYAELGGEVIVGGKPHRPIYDGALEALGLAAGRPLDRRRVLAIGDGMPTDIRGAARQGLDMLMVTSGIHAEDFGDVDAPDMELVAARLADEGLAARAAIAHLRW